MGNAAGGAVQGLRMGCRQRERNVGSGRQSIVGEIRPLRRVGSPFMDEKELESHFGASNCRPPAGAWGSLRPKGTLPPSLCSAWYSQCLCRLAPISVVREWGHHHGTKGPEGS